MNDDLYGHALNEGEHVSFVQWPLKLGLPFLLIILIVLFWFVLPELAAELGAPAPYRPPAMPVIWLLVILFIALKYRTAFKPSAKRTGYRPALVTNQRVIAPNGTCIPLSNISKVHGRWSSVKLDGQKLADGLTIRDMQDARAFRTAIERHLA